MHFTISAWANCTPVHFVPVLIVPVEMHKKNTVLGNTNIWGPCPQAALTDQVRGYAFQEFTYLNKAIMFWLLPLTMPAQVSSHIIAGGRERWGKLNIQNLLKWLRKGSYNSKMVSQPFTGATSFCHSPHMQTKQILFHYFTPVVCIMIGIFQISFLLLFFKDLFVDQKAKIQINLQTWQCQVLIKVVWQAGSWCPITKARDSSLFLASSVSEFLGSWKT